MSDDPAPLVARSVRGTVWALANRFGVAAGSPGELVGALAGLGSPGAAVVARSPVAGEPAEVTELVRALRDLGHIRFVSESGREAGAGRGRPPRRHRKRLPPRRVGRRLPPRPVRGWPPSWTVWKRRPPPGRRTSGTRRRSVPLTPPA
ncbi:hypothetical protein EBF04_24365 [Streptomyces sp. I6]|nr:hypothetical protein EBF04_24365 [Streptomyces sp. I6]